eukprot:2311167-Pleurochrysis_carterae.AAC.1
MMDQANCTIRCAIGVSYQKDCVIQCERRTLGKEEIWDALANGTWLAGMLLIRKRRKEKRDVPHRTASERSRRRHAHAEVVRQILIYACWLGGLLLTKNGRRNGREEKALCAITCAISSAIRGVNMIARKNLLLGTELNTMLCLRWIVALLLITQGR